jgi:hypothetical protein
VFDKGDEFCVFDKVKGFYIIIIIIIIIIIL